MIKKVKNNIFRIKKLMNIKVHELCVNQKVYDNSFNSVIDKRDVI